jgi:O-antigen/teichoic acid export membrane protein
MNFSTTIVLVRSLGPAGFGSFSLAYVFLLLANSLQGALITQPHNVLAAPLEGDAYRDYTTSMAGAQAALAAVFSLPVLLAAGVAHIAGSSHTGLLLAMAFALPGWQLQEFARRALYTKSRVRAAFINDLISYGGQFAGVLTLAWWGRLTATSGLYAVGASSIIAALMGYWVIRAELQGRFALRPIIESWKLGRWLSAATLTNWLASQVYPVLTAGMVGVSGTGIFRALQNLIAPTQILINAFQMLATPRASVAYSRGGRRELGLFLIRGTALVALPLLLYLLLAGAFARPLVTFFYSTAYAREAHLIWPLGLAYLFSYCGRILGIGLAATRETRSVFYGHAVAVVVTWSLGVLLIRLFGLPGATMGAAAAQAAMVVALVYFFHRHRARSTVGMPKSEDGRPPAPRPPLLEA